MSFLFTDATAYSHRIEREQGVAYSHRVEREQGEPFKFATGVCMDAVRKFGADCICDNGGERGSQSVASVAVKCKSTAQEETMQETIQNGLVVQQIVCDRYYSNNHGGRRQLVDDHSIICIHEHFDTEQGTSEYASCNVSVDGKTCSKCEKKMDRCALEEEKHSPTLPLNNSLGEEEPLPMSNPGFVVECHNVEPTYEQETLCFHNKRSQLILEDRQEPDRHMVAILLTVMALLFAAIFYSWKRAKYHHQELKLDHVTKSVYSAAPQEEEVEFMDGENVFADSASSKCNKQDTGSDDISLHVFESDDSDDDDENLDIYHSLWIAGGGNHEIKLSNNTTSKSRKKKKENNNQKCNKIDKQKQKKPTEMTNNKSKKKKKQKSEVQESKDGRTNSRTKAVAANPFDGDNVDDIDHSLWIAMGDMTLGGGNKVKKQLNNTRKQNKEKEHVSKSKAKRLGGGDNNKNKHCSAEEESPSHLLLEEDDIDINHSLWIAMGDTSATGNNEMKPLNISKKVDKKENKNKKQTTARGHVSGSSKRKEDIQEDLTNSESVSLYPYEEEDIDINHSLWIAMGDTATPTGSTEMRPLNNNRIHSFEKHHVMGKHHKRKLSGHSSKNSNAIALHSNNVIV